MASCSASFPGAPPSTIPMCWETKPIVWYPCTPSSTLKTFGETICASTGCGKEIAGLLKKKKKMMMMMMNMMTPKIVKSHMSRFSRAKVEAGTGEARVIYR